MQFGHRANMSCANIMSTCQNLRCLKASQSISIYSFISNTDCYPHYDTCYPLLRGSRWSSFCPQHQIIISIITLQSINIDRDNNQVLVETHLPTPHGRIYVTWGDGIFSKKNRAPRASSSFFLYLGWKHISAWDVKIVKSAVDLKFIYISMLWAWVRPCCVTFSGSCYHKI